MKQVIIVAMTLVVSVLIMLVATIFSYGQAAIAQQAAVSPGIPSADNSTLQTQQQQQVPTPLGMPSDRNPSDFSSNSSSNPPDHP